MKKNIILFVMPLVFGYESFAQTYSPVNTPKCSTADAYIRSELSPALIASFNADAAAQFPNATILDNSSTTYNCHGYAWHKSDGGSTRWIGYYSSSEEDIYWGDGSYVQVGVYNIPAPIATKVSYASDDHSAITTTTPGVLISKWGSWPLMQHAFSDCPYNYSNLKYYAIPVNGSTVVCSSPNTSFQSITPSSGTINYSWTTGSYLTPTSQSGSTNNFSVSATGNGLSYINVQIASSCAGTTVSGRKEIWAGTPILEYIQGPTTVQQNLYYTYYVQSDYSSTYAQPNVSGATYDWYVYGPFGLSYNSSSSVNQKDISFSNAGGHAVVVASQNVCGWGFDEPNLEVYVQGSGFFAMSPNPASQGVDIEFKSDETSSMRSTEDATYLVRVYDMSGVPVLSESKGTAAFSLSTTNLKDGIYTVELNNGKNVFVKRLIVKH